MIIVTTEHVPGARTTVNLGLVRGSSIRARHVGKDILASLGQVAALIVVIQNALGI